MTNPADLYLGHPRSQWTWPSSSRPAISSSSTISFEQHGLRAAHRARQTLNHRGHRVSYAYMELDETPRMA